MGATPTEVVPYFLAVTGYIVNSEMTNAKAAITFYVLDKRVTLIVQKQNLFKIVRFYQKVYFCNRN